MASLNSVVLIGNLCRDPDLRYTPSGTAMAKFGIAINEKYKKGDEWVEKVVFVDITCWGRIAETASEYLSKGKPVAIEGKLNYSTWETDDGGKRSKLDVTATRVTFLGSGSSNQGGGQNNEPAPAEEPPDVPF